MPRSIFSDEVLGTVGGDNRPIYKTIPVGDGIVLELKNPIAQPGTPMTASIMNNMFDFDNLASQSGHVCVVSFPPGMVAQEIITNTATGAVAAKRITITLPNGSLQERTTVYSDAGLVVRDTQKTTTFGAEIREEIVLL